MAIKKLFAACLLSIQPLILSGCGGISLSAVFFDDGFTPIDFQIIAGSSSSAISQPQFAVVRDISTWDALWKAHTANHFPSPAMPAVNFAQNMVIGVFLGSRPNSCYGVAINTVTRLPNPDRIEVTYKESTPPPGVLCAAVITNPSALIVVTHFSLPVQFVQVA
jgi:hypothetical protein